MKKVNEGVRNSIITNGLKYWQVAERVGISAGTFTVWLRKPLEEEKEKLVMESIKKLAEEKEG